MTNRNMKKIIRISSENKNNKTVQKTDVFLKQKGSDRESKKKRTKKEYKDEKKDIRIEGHLGLKIFPENLTT